MANCTYFKLEVNGMMMPEIYFNYDQAKAALENICNNNGVPRIIHIYASTINFKGFFLFSSNDKGVGLNIFISDLFLFKSGILSNL